MLGKVEIEQVTEICRRYCAVSPEGQPVNGYFRVDGGDGAKRARKCAANVPYGELEATKAAVVQRLNSATAEFRWVFLRAMFTNDGHPAETLKLEGNPIPEEEEEEDHPKGKDSAAEALARVSLGLLRSNEQLVERTERLHEVLAENQFKAGIYQYHAEALALTSKSELVTRAVETMGPQLLGQLPQLAAIWAAYQAGQPIPAAAAAEQPPEDPAAAIGWHVDRLAAGVDAIGRLAQAHPTAQRAAAPHIGRLRALVAQVGPMVGLRVTPADQPPPSAAPPPQE